MISFNDALRLRATQNETGKFIYFNFDDYISGMIEKRYYVDSVRLVFFDLYSTPLDIQILKKIYLISEDFDKQFEILTIYK